MKLSEFNGLEPTVAKATIEQCCAAPAWIDAMVASRPFDNLGQLLSTAVKHWLTMDEANVLAAFLAHPKIGDVESLHKKFANTKTVAANEQAGTAESTDAVLTALAKGNETYFQKFGFIFIVFATGKTAQEMLTLLEERLPNGRTTELQNAALEQGKITDLRLKKLFSEGE